MLINGWVDECNLVLLYSMREFLTLHHWAEWLSIYLHHLTFLIDWMIQSCSGLDLRRMFTFGWQLDLRVNWWIKLFCVHNVEVWRQHSLYSVWCHAKFNSLMWDWGAFSRFAIVYSGFEWTTFALIRIISLYCLLSYWIVVRQGRLWR